MPIIEYIQPFDEIITHIYQGSLEANPWQSFVRCLRQRLNCDVAAITLRPARTGLQSVTVWDRSLPMTHSDVDTAMAEQARLAHLDPLSNALCRSGDIFTLDEVISRTELKQSEFYLKVLKPYGNEYMLGMYIAEPNGWKCQVGVMNGPDKPNFGEQEKQLFRALHPHLEHALKVHSLLKRNELEKEIYEEALDRLTIGAIILDGRGKVIEINQVAKNILARSTCISLAGDRLAFAKTRYRVDFNQIVSDAIAWRESENTRPFVDALRVEAADGSHLGLLVRSAPVSRWYHNESSPTVIIYLGDLEAQRPPPEQFVARLFGLTPSEAVLATLLANGLTILEAATQLKLTESSARTYSKKIFAKTGTTRQAELVRLILKSVALLGETTQLREITSPPSR